MIGTLIDDCYRVERLLGTGSFGEVYECTDLELQRAVAVKVLRMGFHGEREMRNFQAEGRNLASLNHPNVVQVYRLGSFQNAPYIVMEYVRGQTLRKLEQDEKLTVRQAVDTMAQVALGLDAVHAIGVLHRDLSPNNVIVTDQGVAKIVDFGLSKAIDGLGSMGSRSYLAGTLYYVAPEQINGIPSGPQAEVFSFGVILYEAVAGHHPFSAEHHMSVLYNIANRVPEPLTSHVDDCPGALSDLVAKCMEKSPDDRPAGMGEVARALHHILESSGLDSSAARRLHVSSAPRQTARNPYLNRNMIKRREDFFGRTHEVKRIYARLNATPPGSISVVGDRKIGKSSLLNHIYAKSSRDHYLEQPDKMIMVFLDFQQEKDMSIETFVKTLLGIAGYELRGRVDVSDCELNLDGIKDMVERVGSAGFKVAILLDEFDTVTTNPNFNLEFFSFLRYLANHYNVAYVTSSARNLQVLCHTKEIADSPFFNIFSNMRLSVFRREEAEELIRKPSERAGKPLAPHTKQIISMAGMFPFFIQMACSHALEYMDEHPDATEPDFKEVRRRFYEEAKLHYRYVWDGFDVHERSTVLRVAKDKSLPDALKHVFSELETRSYVETDKDKGKPRLFASTFEDFVKTQTETGEKRGLLGRLFGRS